MSPVTVAVPSLPTTELANTTGVDVMARYTVVPGR